MSQKIINELNSTHFRCGSKAFKASVLEIALLQGLISYNLETGFFLHKGSILLGLLPDADGKHRFMD